MPELPEVETVRRTLEPAVGMRVTGVWTSGKPLRLNQPVERAALMAAAHRRRIDGLRRWGKYLLIDFAPGTRSVLVHLGMSGRLRLLPAPELRAPHTHVVFSLTQQRRKYELRYSDPRRFGQVSWFERGAETHHPSLANLGVDPLTGELTGELLYRCMRRTRQRIKTFLLDQSVIAGIGNIYASEALWQAGIRPTQRADRVSRVRADRLALAIREVLDRALEHGGTSLRDFVDADGHAGSHSHYLWVYGREGQPCVRAHCKHSIRRTVLQGRATFHCPVCQKR